MESWITLGNIITYGTVQTITRVSYDFPLDGYYEHELNYIGEYEKELTYEGIYDGS